MDTKPIQSTDIENKTNDDNKVSNENQEEKVIVNTRCEVYLIVYFFATLATAIKTVAWWFNQWPFMQEYNFGILWVTSAAIAGCEYLPMTFAFTYASSHGVALSLMTAYMEATDNGFRMIQQYALGDTLHWFDWTAAALLALCVGFQAIFHYRFERANKTRDEQKLLTTNKLESEPDTSNLPRNLGISAIFLAIASLLASFLGSYTGQAYSLATVATACKTFAWWINQYPALKNSSFIQKWLAGWSIAATLEYLPLIGAFTIASDNGVHLGLMTAYMEALDNCFRMIQQNFLGKPLFWFDYVAALAYLFFNVYQGMIGAVVFQGVMNFKYD